jgi:hypothetical protein
LSTNFHTFAAVSIRLKQQIASRVLLAVFLPMLLLSSLHTHHLQPSTNEEECTDCVQHHCAGHIGQLAQTMHECVLCQLLSLPMVVAAAVVVRTFFAYTRGSVQGGTSLLAPTPGTVTLRGPPAV